MKGDIASYKHGLMKLAKNKNKKVLKMWTNCLSLACTSECASIAQKHENVKISSIFLLKVDTNV
jgi:hypothetical protein